MRNWTIRAAAAAVVVGAIVAGVYWLNGTESIAFADVVRAFLDTRTVIYTVSPSGTVDGIELPATQFRVMHMDPGLERVEMNDTIMVMDNSQGKVLMLIPKEKVAVLTTMTTDSPQVNGGFEELRARLEEYQAGQEQDITELGTKMIDGRQAVGYDLQQGGFPMTFWVDVETKLPIVITSTMNLGAESAVTVTMRDFQWGVPLNEELFRLEVPEDYTLQQSQMDMSNLAESDVIQTLQMYADYMDGSFPAKLDMSVAFQIMKPLMASMKDTLPALDDNSQPTPDEMAEVTAAIQKPMLKMMRGVKFVLSLPPSADWHYVGDGVTLDTPDTPIAWYRPDGAETYRVIYADLTVSDVPAAPEPESQDDLE